MRAPHGSKTSIAGRSGTKRTKNGVQNPRQTSPENLKNPGLFLCVSEDGRGSWQTSLARFLGQRYFGGAAESPTAGSRKNIARSAVALTLPQNGAKKFRQPLRLERRWRLILHLAQAPPLPSLDRALLFFGPFCSEHISVRRALYEEVLFQPTRRRRACHGIDLVRSFSSLPIGRVRPVSSYSSCSWCRCSFRPVSVRRQRSPRTAVDVRPCRKSSSRPSASAMTSREHLLTSIVSSR